ncbi:FAD-dependent oxidoreductase [Kutzneria buriramensis]|uniref:2-polyprenyl-6-methoxyphenol hydroxylase-like FAD-dependent oxidoreductase n=1 Tax=Kutzneria buriramensis TaxID=1045776 RepID=A0A3E0HZW9_9PSEU|nr:FAD-dependent oxidoreductase [Kutzneria buriramensis]REH52003.1 2-polyprenyl-6-methoxyphenol hydroxylase-like FAD-dependent oxidoreductase [Kutzneria buriramensis]
MNLGHFSLIFAKATLVDPDDPDLRGHRAVNGGGFVHRAELVDVLAAKARELGVEIRYDAGVTGFDADADGVAVHVGDERIRAGWLVGCDGARSVVRRLVGADFPGVDPEQLSYQAIVDIDGELPDGDMTETGFYMHGEMPQGGLLVGCTEFVSELPYRDEPVTAEELEASLRRVSGREVTVTALHHGSRYSDTTRQAAEYRHGRVLLAGDAAHVHPPFGGQGMNLGIGDAVNLGWKLAATIRGTAPDGLLDTYQEERHPAGKWVQDWTMAQVALLRPDPRSRALRAVMREMLDTVDATTYVVKHIAGVWRSSLVRDVDLGDGSRLAERCRDGRGLLVGDPELVGLATKYGLIFVEGDEPLLVRPDGVVAWAGDGDPAAAVSRWFSHSIE